MITNSSKTFLKDAVVERYNIFKLNKTRIRFKIQLKKTTKSNAPKWTDVLKYSQDEQESDLVKVTTSEVGLKGIKVFKALDEAANQLRQEIASVQEWMNYACGGTKWSRMLVLQRVQQFVVKEKEYSFAISSI